MAPALTSAVDAARGLDQEVRQFIAQYAVTSEDPWALVHAIRGVRHVCHLQALGDNAKALFRFDPVTFDRDGEAPASADAPRHRKEVRGAPREAR
jgi:hypothetical protein